ncbi:MAG: hypothetical protein QOJ87_99 [Verrucomicrobiota bacterium]
MLNFIEFYFFDAVVQHGDGELRTQLVEYAPPVKETEIKQCAIDRDGEQDTASAEHDELPSSSCDSPDDCDDSEEDAD